MTPRPLPAVLPDSSVVGPEGLEFTASRHRHVRSARAVRGRVLVVDDERTVRDSIVRLLCLDHDVVAADSGETAQIILELDQRFDVILCDLMMLGMSGVDLHRWLFGSWPALAARVIFVTGGTPSRRVGDYVVSSGNMHLLKPFDGENLSRLVAHMCTTARE